jgi:hypothetical protein
MTMAVVKRQQAAAILGLSLHVTEDFKSIRALEKLVFRKEKLPKGGCDLKIIRSKGRKVEQDLRYHVAASCC